MAAPSGGGEGPGLNGGLGGAGQRWDVTEDLDILDFCGGVETQEECNDSGNHGADGVGDVGGAEDSWRDEGGIRGGTRRRGTYCKTQNEGCEGSSA